MNFIELIGKTNIKKNEFDDGLCGLVRSLNTVMAIKDEWAAYVDGRNNSISFNWCNVQCAAGDGLLDRRHLNSLFLLLAAGTLLAHVAL